MSSHEDIELVLDQELQGVRDALADTGKYPEASELIGVANGWRGSHDPVRRRADWTSRLCRRLASYWQRAKSQRGALTLPDYARLVHVLGYSPIDWSRFARSDSQRAA